VGGAVYNLQPYSLRSYLPPESGRSDFTVCSVCSLNPTHQTLRFRYSQLGEKNALIATVKKLNRDLAKLDNFKRNLLQSLQVRLVPQHPGDDGWASRCG